MTSAFQILPAIDLRGGRVVRLEQGDFARETAFSDDPVAVARSFAAQGARWLHVVDLDGARTGEPVHAATVAAIVDAVADDLAVEVAGGLRTAESVRRLLESGVARVVIGTAALRDPSFAAALVAEHGPGRMVVALDVRDGRAVGEAWTGGASGTDALEALARLADAGITTFEVTAIDRDGTGRGPDLDLYERVVGLDRGAVVASAGIASAAGITAVRSIGCSGAIIGRALYDGRLTLGDALAVARSREPIEIRRPADGESLGFVRPDPDGWTAMTVFGGALGHRATAAAARSLVMEDGLASLARRWAYRARGGNDWEVVLIQEAWPGRARLVIGPYALPDAPTFEVTAADLAAGARLTLEPPPGSGLEWILD